MVTNEVTLASIELEPKKWQTRLSIPSLYCGGCINKVETALKKIDAVSDARVNLTRKFVDVIWSGPKVPDLVQAVQKTGHEAHLQDQPDAQRDDRTKELIRATAVAGFATSNIMLLSVAVWSGADASLKDLFHWVSAAIALPCLVYSGRIFFRSAWSALRHWQTNMDVPISLGVILAFAMSLYDTVNGQGAVYFDASVMLLFFLLIGRLLDHVMREKAQNAITGLAKLIPKGALVVKNGKSSFRNLEDIQTGEALLIASGERVPLNGKVSSGSSTLDCSLVTGESMPRIADIGSEVLSGMLNLGGDIEIVVTANSEQSFLSQTLAMMERVPSNRSSHQSIADRAAQLYAPFVHSAALITFIIWFGTTGDWHRALTIAIAVLIITCPCALGLAVPITHVVAAQRLFANGVMVRDRTALERMQDVNAIVFDKTGTLTEGNPQLLDSAKFSRRHLSIAASLGAHSSHPYARALLDEAVKAGAYKDHTFKVIDISGYGLEALDNGILYRLGRASWALSDKQNKLTDGDYSEVVLSLDGQLLEVFRFEDRVRASARSAIQDLGQHISSISILSGDEHKPVKKIAQALKIDQFKARSFPADKVSEINRLTNKGHKVLMIGDGLNDAPALAAAHVSMAPSTAADIGRNSADFVFFNGNLNSITSTFQIARKTGQLIKQNFTMAIGYNVLAIPIAMFGVVTPMIAAIAMSVSSFIVVMNALRLNFDRKLDGAHVGATK
jgi:Cu2+-exporting ATPase